MEVCEVFKCQASIHVQLASSASHFSLPQLERFQQSLDTLVTREAPEEKKDAGCLTLEDVTPYVTEAQKEAYLSRLQVVMMHCGYDNHT